MCRLNSWAQQKGGGPSVFGLVREKIIPDDTKYTNLNDEMYSSPDTISVAKYRRIRLALHMAGKRKTKNINKILVGKSAERGQF